MTTTGLVFANVRRHKFRTAMTSLSVAVAVGISVVAFAAVARVREMETAGQRSSRLVVTSPFGTSELPYAYVSRLQAMPEAKSVYWTRATSGDIGDGNRFLVWPVSAEWHEKIGSPLIDVAPGELDAWKRDRQGLLPSRLLLDVLGKKVGDKATFKSSAGEITGTVSGTLGGFYADGALLMTMHYDHFSAIVPPASRDKVGSVLVSVEHEAKLEVAKAIDDSFRTSGQPTMTLPTEQFMASTFYRPLMTVPRLLAQVATLMLVVTIVVTATTLAMALRERRAEFGTLRALGYTRSRILMLVLVESALVCGIGGLIGAGVPFALYHETGMPMGKFLMARVAVTPSAAALGIGIAFMIAFVAGFFPALSTSRVKVVEALGKP